MIPSEQSILSASGDTAASTPRNQSRSLRTRLLLYLRTRIAGIASLTYRYESQRRLFGIPVLSINLGPDTPEGQMRHAKGVIAIGTKATGVLAIGVFIARGIFTIAFLTIGLAGVSIGGIGLLTVSVFGLGVVSVSVVACGYVAVGILAIGFKAVGIVALGGETIGITGVGRITDTVFPLQHR